MHKKSLNGDQISIVEIGSPYRKLLFLLTSILLIFIPLCVGARENVTDWYIKDFNSEIVVNKDSSLTITEVITADCGDGIDKHGIFRIVPTAINLANGKINTPVMLISITDENGVSRKYSATSDNFNKTVTWKIGDPDKTVKGVNIYKITYLVKNAVRGLDDKRDELYWNLNGNFWDIETDHFSATIRFPEGISKDNSELEYYSGYTGEKGKDLARYEWKKDNELIFESTGTLLQKQGITASVVFPKGFVTPYKPGFLELYGRYFSLLIPIFLFFISLYYWRKYGKDPETPKTVIAEYDPPLGLSPIEIGALRSNGMVDNKLISAEIVNMAVKGILKIEEHEKSLLFFSSKDHKVTKLGNKEAEAALNPAQRAIFDKLFSDGPVVNLSDLQKLKFYEAVPDVKSKTKKQLIDKGLVYDLGMKLQILFIVSGVIACVLGFIAGIALFQDILVFLCFLAGGAFLIGFGIAMPKRTPAGANANWKIKGFLLFMKTAEQHRQQFYEKENMFEKLLPYAIAFGITGLWIKKMREIYGEQFYTTYAPAWYAGNMAAFSESSLNSVMSGLSSAIGSNISSPSGSGGSGGSGGGGGGGGGGGW